jgi:hypothetical protein
MGTGGWRLDGEMEEEREADLDAPGIVAFRSQARIIYIQEKLWEGKEKFSSETRRFRNLSQCREPSQPSFMKHYRL